MLLPAYLGLSVGVNVFGDARELKNLTAHRAQYRKEMGEFYNEYYYA